MLETQEDKSLKLFLFLKQDPQTLIGSLNFSNFTRGVFQNCTVGYSLAEGYQEQAYMFEALSAGIEHIFSALQFHWIEANYLPHNQRSEHLLALINNILDISKIAAGRAVLVESEFDLYRLLDEVKQMFHNAALDKGPHLKIERSSNLPRIVYSDRLKLRQILINLLSNAIKFTEIGAVTLVAQTARFPDSPFTKSWS